MAAQECRGRETGSISSGLTPTLRDDWSRKRVLETLCHARIAISPQDTAGHVSGPAKPKVTWDTKFPADVRLPIGPRGYLDRRRDHAIFFPVFLFPFSGGPNTEVSQHIEEDKYTLKPGTAHFQARQGELSINLVRPCPTLH